MRSPQRLLSLTMLELDKIRADVEMFLLLRGISAEEGAGRGEERGGSEEKGSSTRGRDEEGGGRRRFHRSAYRFTESLKLVPLKAQMSGTLRKERMGQNAMLAGHREEWKTRSECK